MYIYFILFQSLVYKRNSFREASRIFSRRISKVYVDLYGVFRFIWIYFEFRRIRIFWNIFRKFRKDSKLSQSLLFPSLFFYHIQNIKFLRLLYIAKKRFESFSPRKSSPVPQFLRRLFFFKKYFQAFRNFRPKKSHRATNISRTNPHELVSCLTSTILEKKILYPIPERSNRSKYDNSLAFKGERYPSIRRYRSSSFQSQYRN